MSALIETYDVEVFTPPCDPGAPRFAARARLRTDISQALPYLNAALRGAVYHPGAPALIWKKGGHTIAFHPYEVATSNVEDQDGALHELRGLIELVNRTWERRDEITPDHHTRQRLTPMALYALLPRTNCKRCGEATCFTFGLRLASSQRQVDECPPLLEPEQAAARAALLDLMVDAPAIG